jgi:serine/threonine-protein kinase
MVDPGRMALAPGTTLGGYEILGLVGSGGMGEVYRAKEINLGRTVAIKVLPTDVEADVTRLARFEAEARLASSLNHPNIITIYGTGQSGLIRYIAMEFVEGQTLKELLDTGPLPLSLRLDVGAQIASGLAKAHQAGIVHRDLKPRNVMVTSDGLVKILDFGVSKLAAFDSGAETTDTLTAPGALLGTPAYMSPEQAAGRPVDARSDQFSFGTMLYEMTCGSNPFLRRDRLATLGAILVEEPALIGHVKTDTPEALGKVIHRCLAKDPADRYDSTAGLADDLRKLHRSHDNAPAVSAVSSRVRRVLAGAALIALVALLAPAYQRAVHSPARETPPSRNEIAILPFTNVGSDTGNQAFADGLVETLTSKLTQVEQSQGAFRIVPASEIRRDRISSVREARQAFAATLAITGSVQRSADRLRVTVNIVDTRSLRQIGARTIDVDSSEVLVIQDGVVLEVVELLGLEIGEQTRERLFAGGTTSPGAYDYYLQGKGYLQRFETPDNIDNAIQLFNRALAHDQNFALAHAGLGEAYWRRYESTRDPKSIEQARASCTTALALNNRLAHVRITLAMVARGSGAYESAVQELRQALAIDPASGDALRELAHTYEALGDFRAAEATYQKSIKVRPGDWVSHNEFGRFYFSQGRYADAAGQFHEVVNLTPDNARGHSNVGGAYAQLQRFPEAIAAFEKSVALRPSDAAYSNLGTIYFRQGRYTDAARMFERAVALNGGNYRVWRNLASSYFWAPGERDKSTAAFERVAVLAEQERKVNPRRPSVLVDLATAYARTGKPSLARAMIAQATAIGPMDAAATFNLAAVLEDLGDRGKALDAVRQALKLGYPKQQVEQSPALTELRKDPEYRRIIQSRS